MTSGFGFKSSVKEYFLKLVWMIWKELQVLFRSHLSLVLTLVLAILVVSREREELYSILKGIITFTHFPGWFDILILVVTGLTIVAAIWEIRGNKLTTSPQELRFALAMRDLLILLEKFGYGQDKDDLDLDLEQRLDQFSKAFLEITRKTLCGKKEIDSGLMTYESNVLKLKISSQGACYPEKLEIPVPSPDHYQESGPAAVAIAKLKITYMPFKRWKRAWLFQVADDPKPDGEHQDYQASDLDVGWIPASNPEYENFRSILCLPVALYVREDKKEPQAVLNYSTDHFDPFVDRDFIMGECFASILAQAIAIARDKAEKQAKAQSESL
jgi:hypothetical protein